MKFLTPVLLKDHKINEWLTMVEKEMRLTLAKLLAQAVSEIAAFKTTSIEPDKYIDWVDKYQVRVDGSKSDMNLEKEPYSLLSST